MLSFPLSFPLLLALLLTSPAPELRTARDVELEPGLHYRRFDTLLAGDDTDTRVHVLRIDPSRFELVLLNASASPEGRLRTARVWGRDHSLLAVINAGMYQEDHRTSVALMTTRTHTNNAYVSRDQCVLAFDPLAADLPPVKLIDRQCDNLDDWRPRYGTLIQGIRMISCEDRNVWSQQARRTSIAAIGLDDAGWVHLVHMTTPQSTHDLIRVLQHLPLQLRGAMYLEGGTPAQLVLDHPELQVEMAGSWCSELAETPEPAFALPIPNVIGVRRRADTASPSQ